MKCRINYVSNSKSLYLLLPGVSQAGDEGLLLNLFELLAKHQKTVLSVTFGFQENRKNAPTSGEPLEQAHEVLSALQMLGEGKWDKIIIIGKSFGGLVAKTLLLTLRQKYANVIDMYILGYLPSVGVINKDLVQSVIIYQGEHDKYCTPAQASENSHVGVVEMIPHADHSYRPVNTNTKPEELLVERLTIRLNI